MSKVRIKVLKIVIHQDLIDEYEIKGVEPCPMKLGDTFISLDGEMPKGFCVEAWRCIEEYVKRLSKGETNIFGKWLKNEKSLTLSCNDGCRPVSFLIEVIE